MVVVQRSVTAMTSTAHLRSLCLDAAALPQHQRICCIATNDWYRYLHDGHTAAVAEDFEGVPELLRAALATTDPSSSDEVLRRVLRLANVSGEKSTDFPGPMCSPLRKREAALVTREPYLVTEKSDGLRLVVAAVWVPAFPRWRLISGMDTTPSVSQVDTAMLQHLSYVALMEDARRQLRAAASDTCTIQLGSQTFAFCPLGDDSFLLKDEEHGEKSKVTYVVQRCLEDRHFAYAIDRSLDAVYLLLDHYRFASTQTMVVDGELMSVLPSSSAATRNAFGVFDLFCYTTPDGEFHNLHRHTMTMRYTKLAELLAPLSTAAAANGVVWFAKQMWPVSEIGNCLRKISYDSATNRYTFSGPYGLTENDGLIFTPDIFPVSIGSSSVQLKWKWRSLLSVDWLLSASPQSEELFTASLFFVKKNYGHRDDVFGHWKLRKPMRMLNPHSLEIPVDGAVVAECVYDFSQKEWAIQRLRQDKQGANSIVTAISVYESLVENISLTALLHLLLVSDSELLDLADQLEPDSATKTKDAVMPPWDEKEAKRNLTAKVSLRAIRQSQGSTELWVNSYTNNTNAAVKYPLPFPMRKIRDCIGLGYSPSSALDVVPSLEDLLYIQLANSGGCYAWSDYVIDVFYHGENGCWELVHLNPKGNNKEAIFDSVVEHLNFLLRYNGHPKLIQQLSERQGEPIRPVGKAAVAETRITSQHYGAVAKELTGGQRSNLRIFNNFIKAVLIETTAQTVLQTLASGGKISVLDVCCGRGGDLLKWQHIRPNFLFMTDASVQCVAEAAARYSTSEGQSTKASGTKQRGFPAYFAVHDAFDPEGDLLLDLKSKGPFQLISCQFSMHYGCRTERDIEYFIDSIATALTPRGRYIGTTVNDAVLLSRASSMGSTYGNDVYTVSFADASFDQLREAAFDPTSLPFGVPYTTTVERSVNAQVEYVVPWDRFVRLCARHHLRLLCDAAFFDYYTETKGTQTGQKLLVEAQKKRGRAGDSLDLTLSPAEQEAVALYRLFIFEKE